MSTIKDIMFKIMEMYYSYRQQTKHIYNVLKFYYGNNIKTIFVLLIPPIISSFIVQTSNKIYTEEKLNFYQSFYYCVFSFMSTLFTKIISRVLLWYLSEKKREKLVILNYYTCWGELDGCGRIYAVKSRLSPKFQKDD